MKLDQQLEGKWFVGRQWPRNQIGLFYLIKYLGRKKEGSTMYSQFFNYAMDIEKSSRLVIKSNFMTSNWNGEPEAANKKWVKSSFYQRMIKDLFHHEMGWTKELW